ncbi:hypothetical protein OFL47_28330, partial [Pseudomonas aeruginosa]|uniref:hypothetical protein n=1 Tax=Pseudomonas aeruginosa TaxID=287 RepID=UPI0021F19A34
GRAPAPPPPPAAAGRARRAWRPAPRPRRPPPPPPPPKPWILQNPDPTRPGTCPGLTDDASRVAVTPLA